MPGLEEEQNADVPRRWRWGLIALCWLVWGLLYASRLRLEVPGIDWGRALLYGLPDAFLWLLLTPIPVTLSRRFPLSRSGNNPPW